MSTCDQRDVTAPHRPLTDRFPKAFSQNYGARVLAHHTRRDGYLLALLHHRGDRRYDLDGQPAGTVTDADRAEAARLLDASTQRGQAKAEQVRTHKAREEKRRQQRAEEQRRREEKARRKAEHTRVQQEIAARKAALIAQGITPESRSERKRRLARASRTGARPPRRNPLLTGRRSFQPCVPTGRRSAPPTSWLRVPSGCRIVPTLPRLRRYRTSSSERSAESSRPTRKDRPNRSNRVA